jgi:acetylglutamate kinase
MSSLPTVLKAPQKILIKLGGSIAENDAVMAEIAQAIVQLHQEHHQVVLVHGGGKAISRNLEWIQEEAVFKDGLRVTSPEAMEVVEMTLSGVVNKKWVSLIQEKGKYQKVRAVGVSGVDSTLLQCEPLPSLGRVGTVTSVEPELLETLLMGGYIPVVSPVSEGKDFWHYNINADEAAGAIAAAMKVDKLLFVSDVPAVLDAQKEPISHLTFQGFQEAVDNGVVQGGMIPKLGAAYRVLEQGVSEVHVCGWKNTELFYEQLVGTGEGTLCAL